MVRSSFLFLISSFLLIRASVSERLDTWFLKFNCFKSNSSSLVNFPYSFFLFKLSIISCSSSVHSPLLLFSISVLSKASSSWDILDANSLLNLLCSKSKFCCMSYPCALLTKISYYLLSSSVKCPILCLFCNNESKRCSGSLNLSSTRAFKWFNSSSCLSDKLPFFALLFN